MVVHSCAQRSDAWHALRLGRLTGTGAADMLTVIKKGEAAARRDLRLRLVCERLTGASAEDGYVSKDMQRGIDLEGAARAAYEAATGSLVRPVGFVSHDTLMAGCSPDGAIGSFAGLLEVKCPKSATHLGYLRARQVPGDYLSQITHNLWITGAAWCDFVSYDPRLGPGLDLFLVRVRAADLDLQAYEIVARLFLSEVERELEDVERLRGTVTVAA